MLYYKFMLYLILTECVIVYCKNPTTYTFNPRISHVRFLSIPKNTMFLGNSHRNSLKTLNRNRFKDHLGNKAPDDDDYDENDSLKQRSSQTKEDRVQNYQKNTKSDFLDGPPDDYNDKQDNNIDDQNYKQVHINNSDMENEDNQENNKNNSQQEIEDNKRVVNDIAKEEQMKDMHNNAGQMMNTAKQAKEKADELLNQYKEGSYTSETNKHSLPKDEAGNIIITNTTTTPVPKHEEEKVDPLKSIRDATLSLFERAKHKNLPVSEPGDLSTPEQIYTALNTLEYIIDGYRYTKIDLNENRSKDEENNSLDSDDNSFMDKEVSSMESENDNLDSNSDDEIEESVMDPDRFLQVKKHDDDDDEDSDENDKDEEEPENEDEDEKGNDFHQEEEEENDEEDVGDLDSKNKSNNNKEKTLSPHEAMEDLRGVLNKLTSILEQVVLENTGVKGVIMRETVKVE